MSARNASGDALPGAVVQPRRLFVVAPDGPLARAVAATAQARGASVALGIVDQDQCDEARVEKLFDEGAERLQAIDAVVVIVATRPLSALHELSVECWRESVTEPLRWTFWVVRRAAEAFLADAVAGRVVLVVETSGAGAGTNDVIETAIRSLAISFAREYGRRGLACNIVLAPAPVDDRAVTAVAEQAVFLASTGASFVNGETLVVRSRASGEDSRA